MIGALIAAVIVLAIVAGIMGTLMRGAFLVNRQRLAEVGRVSGENELLRQRLQSAQFIQHRDQAFIQSLAQAAEEAFRGEQIATEALEMLLIECERLHELIERHAHADLGSPAELDAAESIYGMAYGHNEDHSGPEGGFGGANA